MDKIKVAAVSYLNTLPFITGIESSGFNNEIELTLETPADCAELMLTNKADVGLLPVAVIPKLQYADIITDYCIGCDGEVGSVGILSEVPIEQIEKVLLDYQSRTSVVLAQLLLKEYWQVQPELLNSQPGYEQQIKGTKAGLVIGDRALQLKQNFPNYYDLGKAWKEHTGMPFVFACWVANKPLPDAFSHNFNAALQQGVSSIQETLGYLSQPQLKYLQTQIDYKYGEKQKAALSHFLQAVERDF